MNITTDERISHAEVRKVLRDLPKNEPLPDTPEMREAVLNLIIGMYSPVLKELEKS